jgi:hypothetical protein
MSNFDFFQFLSIFSFLEKKILTMLRASRDEEFFGAAEQFTSTPVHFWASNGN